MSFRSPDATPARRFYSVKLGGGDKYPLQISDYSVPARGICKDIGDIALKIMYAEFMFSRSLESELAVTNFYNITSYYNPYFGNRKYYAEIKEK